MALAIPLPIRVHKIFEWITFVLIFFSSGASFAGVILAFTSVFASMIPPISTLNISLELSQASGYVLSFILAILILHYNRRQMKKAYMNIAKILDLRQPDEIEIRYRGISPFWEQPRREEEEYY